MEFIYRLVHYEPNPFDGQRWTFGALILINGEAKVHVAKAEHLPCALCLGEKSRIVLGWVYDRLETTTSFGNLPKSFGPSVTLGIPRRVHMDVGDPVKWITAHVLPRKPEQ